MQGVQILRSEAYTKYGGMTKDEAQRRRWAFYDAVITLKIGRVHVPDRNFEQMGRWQLQKSPGHKQYFANDQIHRG